MPWSNSSAGDAAFVKASRSIHFDPPEVLSPDIPPKQVVRFAPARISAASARGLVRGVFASLFDHDSMAHLGVATLDRCLLKADLTVGEPTLCYVGFEATAGGVRRGSVELDKRCLGSEEEMSRGSQAHGEAIDLPRADEPWGPFVPLRWY
jgi:hypothetical protein